MALTELARVIPAKPDRPDVGGPDHPMRRVTWEAAFEPQTWTPLRAGKVAALFDEAAPTWADRDGPERHDAVRDALARGGPFPTGPCLEIGAGTGSATAELVKAFGAVVSLDLSVEMLALADAVVPRVQADAARLPVAAGSAAIVALINMFLFPGELARVLRPDGALIWVSTIGDATPIYLSAGDVLAALPGDWDGIAAAAGWGTWLVARRRAGTPR